MSALRPEHALNKPQIFVADQPPIDHDDPPLSLLPAELATIISDIKAVEFSPYLEQWITSYETVGQRGRFLWQWCLKGLGITTLPCVSPDVRKHVIKTKPISGLNGTLIHDIAHREQDREMLQMAVSLASDDWPAERLVFWDDRRRVYLETIAKLWNEIWSRCHTYPRFSEFEHLLRFDNEQILNAMRYALLANQIPGILNIVEHDLYQPHNMQIMFMASVDLSASPGFDIDELGTAREIFWHAQRMGRIGNMITTREREVLDRDFSSGIFAHALYRRVLEVADLRSLPAHEIMSMLENAGCQEYFIQDWRMHRD